MDKQKDVILVTGATGQQGGMVARQLLAHGYKVRAMARKPESEKAVALKRLGAEIVPGDFNDVESLRRAVKGCWGVFSVQGIVANEEGTEVEEAQGKRLAEVAREAGVTHFVYSSVAETNGRSGVGHYDNKWRTEQKVRELGFESHTFLGPVAFMELFSPQTAEQLFPELATGKLTVALKPGTVLQYIAVEDIGKFGLLAFERYEEMNGLKLDIAGDARTMPEVAALMSRAWNKEIEYVQVPLEAAADPNWAETQQWYDNVGWHVNIAALEQKYAMRLTKLEEWFEKHKPDLY